MEFDGTYRIPKGRFQRNLGSSQRRIILVCGALLWPERDVRNRIKKPLHWDSILAPLDGRGEDMGCVVVEFPSVRMADNEYIGTVEPEEGIEILDIIAISIKVDIRNCFCMAIFGKIGAVRWRVIH